MINFFRKVRHQLLVKNQLSRYLIYSMGEVLLVVVGILVALWINNWNEEKKLRKYEIDILNGIKADLVQDTLDLNFNINGHETFISFHNYVLDHLEERKAQTSQFVRLFHALGSSELVIQFRRAFFEEAKVRGLSIITNKELRDRISKNYEFDYPNLTRLENGTQSFDHFSVVNPLLSEYITYEKDSLYISNQKYRQLLNDSRVPFSFFTARNMSNGLLDAMYRPTKKRVVKLISAIDEELKRLED